MKKTLMLILIGLLVTLSIYIVLNGVTIGSIEILGVQQIQEKNNQLDEKIQEAGKLANKDFAQAVNSVKDNAKKLENEKNNYQDMTAISTEGEVASSSQIEKYEIETLWVKLGNHATKEGAVMKMDVEKGNTEETYNLKFTVTGTYIAIEEFISNVENDSTLGFKIEEFKMVPNESGENLQATFVCKEIAIKDVSATTQVVNTDNTMNDGTTNTATTNSTNTTSNTTNSTTNSSTTQNTNVAR